MRRPGRTWGRPDQRDPNDHLHRPTINTLVDKQRLACDQLFCWRRRVIGALVAAGTDPCCDDDGARSHGAAIFQRHDVTVPHSIKADGLPVDEIRPEYSRLLKMCSASS